MIRSDLPGRGQRTENGVGPYGRGRMSNSCMPLKWITPRNLHQDAVEPVEQSGVGKEHEGTMAFDYRRAALPAKLHRVFAGLPVGHGLVDPDFPNVGLVALVQGLVGRSRRRH